MSTPPVTRFKSSQVVGEKGLKVIDDIAVVFGTGNDASVYWDNSNSRLTHNGAEEIFRKYVTVPLYATTALGVKTPNSKFGILAPDRPTLITAARVAWAQVPHTSGSHAIPFFLKKRKYSQVHGTAYNLLFGNGHSADMALLGTAFYPHEYALVATAATKTLAAGDFLYGSMDVPTGLTTAGIGGVLTIEYEVYG